MRELAQAVTVNVFEYTVSLVAVMAPVDGLQVIVPPEPDEVVSVIE